METHRRLRIVSRHRLKDAGAPRSSTRIDNNGALEITLTNTFIRTRRSGFRTHTGSQKAAAIIPNSTWRLTIYSTLYKVKICPFFRGVPS